MFHRIILLLIDWQCAPSETTYDLMRIKITQNAHYTPVLSCYPVIPSATYSGHVEALQSRGRGNIKLYTRNGHGSFPQQVRFQVIAHLYFRPTSSTNTSKCRGYFPLDSYIRSLSLAFESWCLIRLGVTLKEIFEWYKTPSNSINSGGKQSKPIESSRGLVKEKSTRCGV